jgi:hypothetical protein
VRPGNQSNKRGRVRGPRGTKTQIGEPGSGGSLPDIGLGVRRPNAEAPGHGTKEREVKGPGLRENIQ